MMVDAVNENVKEEDDEEEDEEDETEDGSMFEAMFDSEQENRQPVTNIRCVCLNIYCPVYLMSIVHLTLVMCQILLVWILEKYFFSSSVKTVLLIVLN